MSSPIFLLTPRQAAIAHAGTVAIECGDVRRLNRLATSITNMRLFDTHWIQCALAQENPDPPFRILFHNMPLRRAVSTLDWIFHTYTQPVLSDGIYPAILPLLCREKPELALRYCRALPVERQPLCTPFILSAIVSERHHNIEKLRILLSWELLGEEELLHLFESLTESGRSPLRQLLLTHAQENGWSSFAYAQFCLSCLRRNPSVFLYETAPLAALLKNRGSLDAHAEIASLVRHYTADALNNANLHDLNTLYHLTRSTEHASDFQQCLCHGLIQSIKQEDLTTLCLLISLLPILMTPCTEYQLITAFAIAFQKPSPAAASYIRSSLSQELLHAIHAHAATTDLNFLIASNDLFRTYYFTEFPKKLQL